MARTDDATFRLQPLAAPETQTLVTTGVEDVIAAAHAAVSDTASPSGRRRAHVHAGGAVPTPVYSASDTAPRTDPPAQASWQALTARRVHSLEDTIMITTAYEDFLRRTNALAAHAVNPVDASHGSPSTGKIGTILVEAHARQAAEQYPEPPAMTHRVTGDGRGSHPVTVRDQLELCHGRER